MTRSRTATARHSCPALLYVVVFAASTVAAVFVPLRARRLGLVWRDWLTRRVSCAPTSTRPRVPPPEPCPAASQTRTSGIAEDVRTFVTMTLSLSLMFLNGTVTVIAFSGVLWSISRTLFVVGIVYAAAGSVMTGSFGRRPPLNYRQADREADFRPS